jgi:shikimate dehydrogenase
MIQGTTKLLGVIGDPVEHSLSPVMHNAAIAELGVDYVYVPFPIKPANLETAVAGMAAMGVVGFNITIPHKQAILPLLSEVSPIAQAVGAVNTVWHIGTGWAGTNTDVAGFISPLKAQKQDWTQAVAVILGYGGAARAVVAGCTELGISEIHVVGRQPQKLAAFEQSWQNASLPVCLISHPWEELPQLISQASLVVNTTPVGMYPHIHEMPVSEADLANLQPATIVYDLIYTPNPTRFLQVASQRSAITIDGLEMLVQQGAAALQIWLGQPVPVEVMRESLRQKLGLTKD